jgi:A/G-specific adenine glycosylase
VVLVSEVMLQQTQAARVAAVLDDFLDRFPTVGDLAAARRAEVLRAWGRLGYPRRAVALHRAAAVIVERHAGVVPDDIDALLALPGVGPYTSASVASLAYAVPVAAVDTNARRIWARVDRGAEPDEVRARDLAGAADAWLDRRVPAEWNQAVMDLGREVCRPRPRCDVCPLRRWCAFADAGRVGRPSTKRQPPFEGSLRQVRGGVTAALRDRSPIGFATLVRVVGAPRDRVAEAVRGLDRDGVVTATPAALAGRDRGRVGFPP